MLIGLLFTLASLMLIYLHFNCTVFLLFQMQQEIWAVDLDLHYTDSHTMFNLFNFVTGGKLDPVTHYYDIPPPKREEKKTRRRRVKEDDEVRRDSCNYICAECLCLLSLYI